MIWYVLFTFTGIIELTLPVEAETEPPTVHAPVVVPSVKVPPVNIPSVVW